MNRAIEPLTFTVSLSLSAHRAAEKFSRKQSNPQKAKQVYLNTLSVYAVNFYLECLGFETDLENSDSWNPAMQVLLDAADLEVKNLGKLECRAVLPDAEGVDMPPEVWDDRIGCVAVQLGESLREATLLGFVKTAQGKVSLSQLASLEELPEYLRSLSARSQPTAIREPHLSRDEAFEGTIFESKPIISHPNASPATPYQSNRDTPNPIDGAVAKLKQWFEGIFEADWQPAELVVAASFRSSTRPASGNLEASKGSISRAKVIDLGMQLAGTAVALVVRLTPTSTEEVDVRLRLYPARENYLAADLKLSVVDESGTVCMEAQSRRADNWIQLQFGAAPGEHFSAIVALGDVSIRENFVV